MTHFFLFLGGRIFGGLAETFGRIYSANLAENFGRTVSVVHYHKLILRKNLTPLSRKSNTVWKSTQKRYHAQKFSVKPHNKNMLILLLQMHDFLLFVGIFWSSGLIEFSRLVYMLEFLVKTFLNHLLQLEISFAQNRATFNACIYFSYQTFPGISMPNGSSDPPLPRYIEKPCANLREKLLFAIS